jgi:Tat protein translocase TatB subunit
MNIGWQEILLVMIFALIVFGPKRLPEIGRQIGRAIREVRKVSSEFEREVKTSLALEDDDRKARERYRMDEHHSRFVTQPEVGDEAAQAPEHTLERSEGEPPPDAGTEQPPPAAP